MRVRRVTGADQTISLVSLFSLGPTTTLHALSHGQTTHEVTNK